MIVKVRKPQIDKEKILKAVLVKPSPTVLRKIGRTKKFVTHLLEGKSVLEAKIKSGIAPSTPSSNITGQPVARLVMKAMIDSAFSNKKYVKKLKQLWDAKDRRATKDGDIYETPNWPTQVAAFDRVTKARDLVADDDEAKQPQGITVQIVGEGNVHIKDMSIP